MNFKINFIFFIFFLFMKTIFQQNKVIINSYQNNIKKNNNSYNYQFLQLWFNSLSSQDQIYLKKIANITGYTISFIALKKLYQIFLSDQNQKKQEIQNQNEQSQNDQINKKMKQQTEQNLPIKQQEIQNQQLNKENNHENQQNQPQNHLEINQVNNNQNNQEKIENKKQINLQQNIEQKKIEVENSQDKTISNNNEQKIDNKNDFKKKTISIEFGNNQNEIKQLPSIKISSKSQYLKNEEIIWDISKPQQSIDLKKIINDSVDKNEIKVINNLVLKKEKNKYLQEEQWVLYNKDGEYLTSIQEKDLNNAKYKIQLFNSSSDIINIIKEKKESIFGAEKKTSNEYYDTKNKQKIIQFETKYNNLSKKGYIDFITTNNDYRGNGIAQQLIEKYKQECFIKNQYNSIGLYASDYDGKEGLGNFYFKQGFKPDRKTLQNKNYYNNDGMQNKNSNMDYYMVVGRLDYLYSYTEKKNEYNNYSHDIEIKDKDGKIIGFIDLENKDNRYFFKKIYLNNTHPAFGEKGENGILIIEKMIDRMVYNMFITQNFQDPIFLTNDCDILYGTYKLPNPKDKNYTNDKRKSDIFNSIREKFNFDINFKEQMMKISKSRYQSSQAYGQYETYEKFKGVEIQEVQRNEKFTGEGKKNKVQLWVDNEK